MSALLELAACEREDEEIHRELEAAGLLPCGRSFEHAPGHWAIWAAQDEWPENFLAG